ncbi:barstar family protein [Kitasatospora sp. NPDC093550]|uniref:barstar family protein n=1 Tax=Kitasatospora sp. NPDC093550 TaxID=3364089 RepID=UPI003821A028
MDPRDVAWLDGGEMGDEQRLYEQLSVRLRLPAYFGWSWNALTDCLRDLASFNTLLL